MVVNNKNSYPEKLIISPQCLYQELDSESVILNMQSGLYYSLNEVGTYIWAMLVEERTLEEIIANIVTEFEVTVDQAQRDLFKLIQELLTSGLVEEA